MPLLLAFYLAWTLVGVLSGLEDNLCCSELELSDILSILINRSITQTVV